ncbi:MAG: LysM peptidoglycan-binding domain-containing protein [Victivallaceae bacterium]
MKLLKYFLMTVMLAGMLLGGVSCGLYEGKESAHPFFINAQKFRKNGDYQNAVVFFNKYLKVKPDSARAHLELASLYDENMGQPLMAVYHYQCFLELDPRSQDAANVKQWLETAKKKYYFKTRLEYNDPEDVAALQNSLAVAEKEQKKILAEKQNLLGYINSYKQHISQQNKKVTDLQQEKVKVETELALTTEKKRKLQEELQAFYKKYEAAVKDKNILEEKLKAELAVEEQLKIKIAEAGAELAKKAHAEAVKVEKTVEAEPIIGQKVPGITAPITAKELEAMTKVDTVVRKQPEPFPPAENKPVVAARLQENVPGFISNEIKPSGIDAIKFYTVEKGDTLTKISRRFYGTAKYHKNILDLNRDVLNSELSLKPGQVLKIPPLKVENKN